MICAAYQIVFQRGSAALAGPKTADNQAGSGRRAAQCQAQNTMILQSADRRGESRKL